MTLLNANRYSSSISLGRDLYTLVGDFNDWTASPAYEMKRKKSYWFIEIKLPEGEFRYGYQVRGCLFEDPDSEYMKRSLGWPRSCVRCPIRDYCKLTSEKSNRSTAFILKNTYDGHL